MTNEGASGQKKGTEFTRSLSLWGPKTKETLRALLCVPKGQN